uniref:zinc finger matrin-type protein 5 isoform X2 n=1 Tax=Myxine glutinosa TaxID=7769 RepID=UPI00358FE273
MGRRYFCDFCGRSFQDNLPSRRRHIGGAQHQRLRRAWYEANRDTATLLAEESQKRACRQFLITGRCEFGSSCRFSHYAPEQLEMLRQETQGGKEDLNKDGQPPPTLEAWLRKRENRSFTRDAVTLPEGLPPLAELPPSLLPPPCTGWDHASTPSWGLAALPLPGISVLQSAYPFVL